LHIFYNEVPEVFLNNNLWLIELNITNYDFDFLFDHFNFTYYLIN